MTTLAKTCRHGKEEMRQYGKFVFSLFFFHGTRASFTKFELKFFFVDSGLGEGRDGAKRKTATSRLRKKKKKKIQ